MVNSPKRPLTLFLTIFFLTFPTSGLFAISKWGCFGAGVAEWVLPGLGYGLTRQWDKAIILGGARLVAYNQYAIASNSEYYQKNSDDIYTITSRDKSESGKEETEVRMTKETWTAHYYGNIYSNLLMVAWGDLYQNECQPNTETYDLMLSPFRFSHFYDKWEFWLPTLIALGNYSYFSNNSKVTYYLRRGLKESDLKRSAFPEYYMVGVGEEMFFRGTVQSFFFDMFKESWGISPSFSRHLSVVSASAIFAAAHSGNGFTASPAGAFLFGLYEGYVYHPSLEEFDLTTAIAVHAWWDIAISYAILNHAEFNESNEDIQIPILQIAFRY